VERKTSSRGSTALHLAAQEGHSALVELLVGYGADVNAADEHGNTPLMLVVALKKMKPLDQNSPHLKQIEEVLLKEYGLGLTLDPYVIAACMLVQEGADPLVKNIRGESPLQKCAPDIGSVIRLFAQKQGLYRGSLKSKLSTLPTELKRRKVVPPEPSEDSSQQALAGFPKHLKEGSKPVEGTGGAAATSTAESTTAATDSTGRAPATTASTTDSQTSTTTSDSHKPATSGSSGGVVPPPLRTGGERGLEEGTGSSGRPTGEAGGGEGGGKVPHQSESSTATPASRQDSDDRLCCLCDLEINAVLSPCGHSVMCMDCANIAKRCPVCNERIQGSTALC
jgi:hypothetical protein